MSDTEHNKGRLIPIGVDTENFTEDDYDQYRENGFVVIDGEIYEVIWEIQAGELYGFAKIKEYPCGEIDFETYHYNGGAHWTEVVERELQ